MGVLAGFICNLFPKDNPESWKNGPKYTIVLFGLCAFIGFFSSIFIKEELRRLRPKEDSESNKITEIKENPNNNGI